MASAAVAYSNLADAGTVTASSRAVLMPETRLQDPHVARKWRGLGGVSEYLTIDLGSAQTLDTVALMGLNLTAAGITRVRVSAADATAVSGDLYDSTAVAGQVDPSYGYMIVLLGGAVSGRYVRIDLTDASLSYIEAGRLFVGARTQFSCNFAPGWSRAYVDRSRKTESRGGQTYIDRNVSYRTVEVTFEWLSAAERYGAVETIDRVSGEHDDVLLVTDPDSTNLGRDSIWGLIDGNQPVTETFIASPAVYRKTFHIRERL